MEIPSLVVASASHFDDPVRRLALSIDAWHGRHPRRLVMDDHVVRIGWFHVVDDALVAVGSNPFEMVNILVLPPEWPAVRAQHAFAVLARSTGWEPDPDVLLASLSNATDAHRGKRKVGPIVLSGW